MGTFIYLVHKIVRFLENILVITWKDLKTYMLNFLESLSFRNKYLVIYEEMK